MLPTISRLPSSISGKRWSTLRSPRFPTQIKKGLQKFENGADEIDKAAKALDKGNLDEAQKHYDKAIELLDAGTDLLP